MDLENLLFGPDREPRWGGRRRFRRAKELYLFMNGHGTARMVFWLRYGGEGPAKNQTFGFWGRA